MRHGSRARLDVALTFDMGGRVGDAVAIAQWLTEHDLPATIFVTGAMANSTATDAGRRVLALAEANPALFELGNHSYSHRDFRTLTTLEMQSELRLAEEALGRHCAQDLRPLFRPPYGGSNTAVLAVVGAADYRWSVLWEVDAIDWKPTSEGGPTAEDIVASVTGGARNGSIILFHMGGYNTLEALPQVIAGLRDRGFGFVNVSTLLRP